MKIAVAGPSGYASFKIRAATLAAVNGWDLIDCRRPPPQRYDTIWLVKRHLSQSPGDLQVIRKACDRLVVDPLDWVASPSRIKDVERLWSDLAAGIGVDDWIATSPACAKTMAESGPRVHMLPHQSDHRIAATWHNPDGPIVYAGLKTFIAPALESIKGACEILGRRFVCHMSGYNGWRSLEGAALQICFRMPPHDGPFERNCRSQIKLANSAAGHIPAVCCGTEAERSLWPMVLWAPLEESIKNQKLLAKMLREAMDFQSVPTPAYTLVDFAADARRVVEDGENEMIAAEPWADELDREISVEAFGE